MNIRRAAAGASFAALLPFAGTALAQSAPQSTQSAPANAEPDLRQEIEEQKQRLLILERKLEIQQEAATAAAASPTNSTARVRALSRQLTHLGAPTGFSATASCGRCGAAVAEAVAPLDRVGLLIIHLRIPKGLLRKRWSLTVR